MFEAFSRAGLAGGLMAFAIGAAQAQQASGPANAGQGAAPQPCSGFMCLFSHHSAPEATAQPAPQPAEAAVSPAAEDKPVKVKAKASRPARPVTIAAAPAERLRLKAMANLLPRTRVRFVEPGAARSADLVVLTRMEPSIQGGDLRLFTEQLHVVAGSGIHSLSELKEKVVSFGPAGAPTQAAARKAFEALGVTVKETPLDLDNALDGLATGDVDAVVVLAPDPSEQLEKLRTPGLHLLAWPVGTAAPDGATLSSVPGRDYPRLASANEAIRTLGVDAVLETNKAAAKQPAVRQLLASINGHSAELTRHGFDRLRADLLERSSRRVASAERR